MRPRYNHQWNCRKAECMTHPGVLFLCQMLTQSADIHYVQICQTQSTDQAPPENKEGSIRSAQHGYKVANKSLQN